MDPHSKRPHLDFTFHLPDGSCTCTREAAILTDIQRSRQKLDRAGLTSSILTE